MICSTPRAPGRWPLLLSIALITACSLNPSQKDRCTVDNECLGGYVCEQGFCVRRTANAGGTGHGGDGGGSATAGTNGTDAGAGTGGSVAGGSGGAGTGGGASADAADGGTATDGGDASDADGAVVTCDPSLPFAPPVPVYGLNRQPGREFRLHVSPDELTAYVSAGDNWWTADLFVSQRTSRGEPFGPLMPLTALNTAYMEDSVALTADGLTVVFDSDRKGAGGRIYMATRLTPTAPFGVANEVVIDDGSVDEYDPFVSPDGSALYFSSNGKGGAAGIYRVALSGMSAGPPTPVVLGSDKRFPLVTPDERTIYFAADKDIWTMTRASREMPFSGPTRLSELSTSDYAIPQSLSSDGCRLYLTRTVPGTQASYSFIAERRQPDGAGRGGTGGNAGTGGGASGIGGTGGGGMSGAGGSTGGASGTGGAGSTGTGGIGGSVGVCSSSVVVCGQPSSCEVTNCGGRLWRDGHDSPTQYIPFRIKDPFGRFSAEYKSAIRRAAADWQSATSGLLSFQESTSFSGRFISVVPGEGDGITTPDALEQLLPMPVAANGGPPPLHRIAHQWGHVAGLAHTYQRADRDRYMRFDPAVWCGPSGSGLPPRCALTPQDQKLGGFSIPSDTFGAFDEKSKMNGFATDGVCGAAEPDANAGVPTLGDASAAQELFFSAAWGWSPFRPIGRSVSPTQPLDYQLSKGVDPVGTPAIAGWEPWPSDPQWVAAPEIFVRGTDDRIYASRLDPPKSQMSGWTDWEKVGDDVESDPAAVFADATTVYLAFRAQQDSQIHLVARTDGDWGQPAPIGAPPTGAASAPAIAAHDADSLYVAVMGGDGLVYLRDCDDASQLCAGTATTPSAWMALPALPPGAFVGAPSVVWLPDNGALMLSAVGQDRRAYVVSYRPGDIGEWRSVDSLALAPGDPNPGVTVQAVGNFYSMGFWARGQTGLLVNASYFLPYPYAIGGVLASVPAAVGGRTRVDVAALIDDHGKPGVWWRFDAPGYAAPCSYNQPGTCGQCGL